MLGLGRITNVMGKFLDSGATSQAGNVLSGLAFDLVVALTLLAIVVVVALLYEFSR